MSTHFPPHQLAEIKELIDAAVRRERARIHTILVDQAGYTSNDVVSSALVWASRAFEDPEEDNLARVITDRR